MCYSAQIREEWRSFCRHLGIHIPILEYVDLFWSRVDGRILQVPKAMEAMFADPRTDDERRVKQAIDDFNVARTAQLERELFELRTRLANAERKLAAKPTRTAENDRRIASSKIEQRLGWLGDLKRSAPTEERDSRIYPGWYVPVIVMEDGQRVLKPMRYQCRPAGKPAYYDEKYPGTYNARRDNLEGFWKDLFGYRHGIMVATAFFENVQRDGKNAVLEFKPQGMGDMLVACLWSRWTKPGEPGLTSFAAITDEPPAEVAAAGHDRCIIPIKPEYIDVWLNPKGNLRAMYEILDDRERPYYEHRLAA
jgi:putative SOS response-associated peptidase YedK